MAESCVHSTHSTIPHGRDSMSIATNNNNLDIHISTYFILKDTDFNKNCKGLKCFPSRHIVG